METVLQRTELLLGNKRLTYLKKASVMVIGIGGVGSYCAEALARCGIGKIHLADGDQIVPSNLNRQIHATYETIGKEKTEVMKQRILSFRSDCEVVCHPIFYDASKNDILFQDPVDFVVDAIDTISSKLDLITYCLAHDIAFISSLGMANRIDPTSIIVTELMKTNYDPLAKAMRTQVRKRGICGKIPVVFSNEHPNRQINMVNEEKTIRKEKFPLASSPFVPAAAGLACASYAVRTILEQAEAKAVGEGKDKGK